MSSISEILAAKMIDEPEEVKVIKDFVADKYSHSVSVMMQTRSIVIQTPSAALAGSLRMDIPELIERLHTDKRLVIRIST